MVIVRPQFGGCPGRRPVCCAIWLLWDLNLVGVQCALRPSRPSTLDPGTPQQRPGRRPTTARRRCVKDADQKKIEKRKTTSSGWANQGAFELVLTSGKAPPLLHTRLATLERLRVVVVRPQFGGCPGRRQPPEASGSAGSADCGPEGTAPDRADARGRCGGRRKVATESGWGAPRRSFLGWLTVRGASSWTAPCCFIST